jgi:hypothetical protein
MAKVWDLVDPATRALMAAAVDGDTEAEEAARSLLPERRHDVVATCPASKLPDLAAAHPELVDEIARRRSGDVVQL